ncbi:MAG: ERF family protein [Planctomycetota bacterium]
MADPNLTSWGDFPTPAVKPSQTFGAKLAAALAKAQAEMSAAIKDAMNPHFNSSYADLASVWDACRGPLTKHGLSVIQRPSFNGSALRIETILLHESGEHLSSTLAVPVNARVKNTTPDVQAVGSAMTYARRYALMAMVGIAPDDDDGNAAALQDQNRDQQKDQKQPSPKQEKPDNSGFVDAVVIAAERRMEGAVFEGFEVPEDPTGYATSKLNEYVAAKKKGLTLNNAPRRWLETLAKLVEDGKLDGDLGLPSDSTEKQEAA